MDLREIGCEDGPGSGHFSGNWEMLIEVFPFKVCGIRLWNIYWLFQQVGL